MNDLFSHTAKKTTQEHLLELGETLVQNVRGADRLTDVITNYIAQCPPPATQQFPVGIMNQTSDLSGQGYYGHIHNEFCPVNCRLSGHIHNEYYLHNCPK